MEKQEKQDGKAGWSSRREEGVRSRGGRMESRK